MLETCTPVELAATHSAAFALSRGWSADEIAQLLDSPLVFVSGTAKSFALVRLVADEAELLTLATHPNHQRQGHAQRVMQDWQATAQKRGATEAFLEVAADNAPALTLYQSNGFATCGIRKSYYARKGANAVDAVMMRRTFSALTE